MGRYDELLCHIREHKWYINLKKTEEIPFEKAAVSWYDQVYFPIITILREAKLLAACPQATEADLYVFIGKHWSELNRRYGPLFTLEEAAEDFTRELAEAGCAVGGPYGVGKDRRRASAASRAGEASSPLDVGFVFLFRQEVLQLARVAHLEHDQPAFAQGDPC